MKRELRILHKQSRSRDAKLWILDFRYIRIEGQKGVLCESCYQESMSSHGSSNVAVFKNSCPEAERIRCGECRKEFHKECSVNQKRHILNGKKMICTNCDWRINKSEIDDYKSKYDKLQQENESIKQNASYCEIVILFCMLFQLYMYYQSIKNNALNKF